MKHMVRNGAVKNQWFNALRAQRRQGNDYRAIRTFRPVCDEYIPKLPKLPSNYDLEKLALCKWSKVITSPLIPKILI